MGARLVAALLLCVTTVLVLKADPREHCATPPRPGIAAVQEDPADPDEGLELIDLALLLVRAP